MRIKHFSILSMLFILVSCAPIYIPNAVNVPLLSQRNEASINLGLGKNGTDMQFSYAVSDNIGFLLNGAYLSKEVTENSSHGEIAYEQKFKYLEAAIGYFGNLREDIILEVYLGGGFGNAASMDTYNILSSEKIYGEGNFYKLFLQADIGVKGKIFEGGFALRTAYVHFNSFKFDNYNFAGSPNDFFMEPVVFMRLGGPIVKFQAQLGFASKLSNNEFLMYEPLILSIGVIFRINSSLLD